MTSQIQTELRPQPKPVDATWSGDALESISKFYLPVGRLLGEGEPPIET